MPSRPGRLHGSERALSPESASSRPGSRSWVWWLTLMSRHRGDSFELTPVRGGSRGDNQCRRRGVDVLASKKRTLATTRRFFIRAIEHAPRPAEVPADRAPAYPRLFHELSPAVGHVMEQHANNPVETDHGRLKSPRRPMRGLIRLRSAQVISAGHAVVQNLRRRHYELDLDSGSKHRLPGAFAELAHTI